jgi:uncharacterized LabA/DUF88 family protein
VTHDARLRIAVFIDFDNIEIGVKNTLGSSFDAGLVLEALKERGEVVSKTAYSDWQRAGGYSRQLTQHAIRMVQRNMTPGGDKNGADINLALDALEMAFTHPHINAFVIVGGDSDFISLVEKLKQYDKKVFVVGGRQFTSVVMQRNCHEFIAYENLAGARRQAGARGPQPDRTPIDQVIPLVTRALKVISEREASPQMGLLKSTLVQLDSTFSERSYGAGSFRDFVDKMEKLGVVKLHHGGKGGMLVELAEGQHVEAKPAHAPEHVAEHAPELAQEDDSEQAMVRRTEHARPADGRGTGGRGGDGRRADAGRAGNGHPQPALHASPADNGDGRPAGPIAVTGTPAEGIREFRAIMQSATVTRWPMYLRNVKQLIRQQNPSFDERAYGFANLADLLRGAHKENVIRVERDRQGVLRVFQAAGAQAAPVAAQETPAEGGVSQAPAAATEETAATVDQHAEPAETPAAADETPIETPKPRRRSPARKTARKDAVEPRKKKARA